MQTSDYTQFVIPGNWQRSIKEGHVNAIVDSMKSAGNQMALYPIKCKETSDGRLLVLDGQHRLKAAEKLGEDVHYMIAPPGSLGAQEVATISRATRGWTTQDYLDSYANRNRSAYKFIKETIENYNMTIGSIFLFIGTTKSDMESFKSGETTIDRQTRRGIIEFLDYATELKNIDYKRRRTLRALWTIYNMEGFNEDRLKRRLETYPGMFHEMPRFEETLDNLIATYNYRTVKIERL